MRGGNHHLHGNRRRQQVLQTERQNKSSFSRTEVDFVFPCFEPEAARIEACIHSGWGFKLDSTGCKKKAWLYVSLCEKDTTSHSMYYLSKLFPDKFVVSICSFKAPTIHLEAHFVDYGSIERKMKIIIVRMRFRTGPHCDWQVATTATDSIRKSFLASLSRPTTVSFGSKNNMATAVTPNSRLQTVVHKPTGIKQDINEGKR